MKTVEILPLTQQIAGEIDIPGSKSYTNRALIMGALNEGKVEINNPLLSDDTEAMIKCLEKLGIKITVASNKITVWGSYKNIKDMFYDLDVNMSGTTARFILALCAVVPGTQKIYGQGNLNNRPIGELVSALRQLGADIEYLGEEGFPPLLVKRSKLKPGITKMKGDISSQYFSAILMIAPLIGNITIVVLGKQISKPYIDMTIDTMKQFGVKIINQKYKKYIIKKGQKYSTKEYTVEGDFSSAGYFFAIAALTKSTLKLKNLNHKSKQADLEFVEILQRMGNKISLGKDFIKIAGNSIIPVKVNMESCPDQVQTLAVLSAFADGKTTITGVKSLRIKETERIKALQQELSKMGIKTRSNTNSITIYGGSPQAATINTYGDHRMAMSFAIAGAKLHGLLINNPEVVSKTFPNFWGKLKLIGIKTKEA